MSFCVMFEFFTCSHDCAAVYTALKNEPTLTTNMTGVKNAKKLLGVLRIKLKLMMNFICTKRDLKQYFKL